MTNMALPLLLLLCLHGDAQEQDNECKNDVRVKRYTVKMATEMHPLNITCPVVHCGMGPDIRWCKLDANANCLPINKTDNIEIYQEKHKAHNYINILTFLSISIKDAGLYRCKSFENVTIVSHSIKVIVNAAKDSGNSQNNKTRTTIPLDGPEQNRETQLDWLLYIYISAGALVFTIIVIVAICILKSKGSKRRLGAKRAQDQAQMDLQYSASLNTEGPPPPARQASPCPGLPNRPRSLSQRPPNVQSSCGPTPAPNPARRTSRTKRTPAPEAPPPSGNTARPVTAGGGGIYDNDKEEAETPIVYAALNHQVARKGPSHGHTYIPMEELTEYAAIRLS